MGDVAKFQFLGKVLGTPHLSGYPTYIMLNYVFVNLFPKGTLAIRANLLSAVFSLITSGFLFEILVLLGLRDFIALITALTFGFTQTMWQFSLMAEVYSLNILFTSSVIYFLLKWNLSKNDRFFYIACALYALSFGNHLTTIGGILAFAYMVWMTDRTTFWDLKKIGMVIFFVLIGFSQYGYIAWRSADPNPSFLEIDWNAFMHFLRGFGLPSITQNPSSEIFTIHFPLILSLWWKQFYLLLVVVIWGFFQVKNKVINIFLVLCLLGNLAFSLLLGVVREYSAFFLPVFLVSAIYVGYGLDYFSRFVLKNRRYAYILIVIPILFLSINYKTADLSDKRIHAQIVEKVLTTVKQDAVIIVDEYDYSCYFWYYLIGENYQSRGLYSFPIAYAGKEGIQAYLKDEKPFYFRPQKKYVPLGLPVYVLWTIADKIESAGMIVEDTDNKYIYRVRLSDP